VHRSTPTTPARVTSQGGRRAGVAARTRLDFWFDAAILVGYTASLRKRRRAGRAGLMAGPPGGGTG